MTSAMINVALTPARENKPTDAETDIRTIAIPTIPRVNLDCTKALAGLVNKDFQVTVTEPRASDA